MCNPEPVVFATNRGTWDAVVSLGQYDNNNRTHNSGRGYIDVNDIGGDFITIFVAININSIIKGSLICYDSNGSTINWTITIRTNNNNNKQNNNHNKQ